MLRQFKKEAAYCLQLVPENDWDWLVVAQHHTLRTRLLDWTFDPYVALWFALSEASKQGSKPEVWVMNPLSEDVIATDELNTARPFSGTRTKIFMSTFNIPRLKQQQGCFVLFKHVEESQRGFIPLTKNKDLKNRISKVRIETHVAESLLERLAQKKYTKERLFPEIDNVAKLVEQRVLGAPVS